MSWKNISLKSITNTVVKNVKDTKAMKKAAKKAAKATKKYSVKAGNAVINTTAGDVVDGCNKAIDWMSK